MSHRSVPRHPAGRGIRVLALDLDGTILEPGETIRSDVIELLRVISARGIRCVTATGRPIDFQLELLAQYDLSACFEALVADERELYFRRGATFTPDQEWNGWIRSRWQERVVEALEWVQRAHQETVRRGWTARPASDAEITARGLATLRFDDPEPAAAICAWLSDFLAGHGGLACTRNTTNVQVYDVAAGKGAVLTRLTRRWAIRPAAILAVGDSANDHDMLDGSHGFRCATVANATDAVKSAVHAADGYVAHAPSGAGVVEAIRALVPEASPGWFAQETGTDACRSR